jgi:hypothetical protein
MVQKVIHFKLTYSGVTKILHTYIVSLLFLSLLNVLISYISPIQAKSRLEEVQLLLLPVQHFIVYLEVVLVTIQQIYKSVHKTVSIEAQLSNEIQIHLRFHGKLLCHKKQIYQILIQET